MIFGEDVGKIGDVNQGTEGLQKKYGPDGTDYYRMARIY